LSSEDKKRVIEGRQKSAEQSSTQGSSALARNLSSVLISTPDADHQSQLTGATGTVAHQNAIEQSILQGTIQGSAAIGDK
jgi:hypothetical protein